MTTQNQRPGVYSRYDVTSTYASPRSSKSAAVVARAQGGEPERLYRFSSYSDACEVFSPDSAGTAMRGCIGLLFDSGVSEVLAVPVGDSYKNALDVIEPVENIGAVICDATSQDDLTALKSSVLASSDALRERAAFCGISDPVQAIAAARTLNCERVVLACPEVSLKNGEAEGVFAAAALAGKILAAGDPAANWNSDPFPLLSGAATMPESTIQSLLTAGVCAFESAGGAVECIRALTTRTKTNGAADRTLSGVNAILIIDDVMQTLRASLKARLRGGRIFGATLESIHSQVVIELAAKRDEGLIEGFQTPRVYPSDYDPAVCVVELSFTVARVIGQIHVTAHIQV